MISRYTATSPVAANCAIALAAKLPRSTFKSWVFRNTGLLAADEAALRISGLPRTALHNYRDIAMAASGQGDGDVKLPLNPEVQKTLQGILADSTLSNGWDECWKEGVTPWDVGGVTPVVQALVDQGQLPVGRALVPGCGSGHDVLALASESRQVIGLDISETANRKAKQRSAESPKGDWVEFLVADFFEYSPDSPFNLIFDYTFFCAIDPSFRPAWAAKMADLLTPDGELITLMFPVDKFEGGPPFAVSEMVYEELLSREGFIMTSCKDNKLAVLPRKGREKIAHWKRTSSKI